MLENCVQVLGLVLPLSWRGKEFDMKMLLLRVQTCLFCHTCNLWSVISPSSAPVITLSYMPRATSDAFPCGGLLVGNLKGVCFWEMKDAKYNAHVLPLDSGGCTDIQTESNTRQCLVTYRPGEYMAVSNVAPRWPFYLNLVHFTNL